MIKHDNLEPAPLSIIDLLPNDISLYPVGMKHRRRMRFSDSVLEACQQFVTTNITFKESQTLKESSKSDGKLTRTSSKSSFDGVFSAKEISSKGKRRVSSYVDCEKEKATMAVKMLGNSSPSTSPRSDDEERSSLGRISEEFFHDKRTRRVTAEYVTRRLSEKTGSDSDLLRRRNGSVHSQNDHDKSAQTEVTLASDGNAMEPSFLSRIFGENRLFEPAKTENQVKNPNLNHDSHLKESDVVMETEEEKMIRMRRNERRLSTAIQIRSDIKDDIDKTNPMSEKPVYRRAFSGNMNVKRSSHHDEIHIKPRRSTHLDDGSIQPHRYTSIHTDDNDDSTQQVLETSEQKTKSDSNHHMSTVAMLFPNSNDDVVDDSHRHSQCSPRTKVPPLFRTGQNLNNSIELLSSTKVNEQLTAKKNMSAIHHTSQKFASVEMMYNSKFSNEDVD